LKDEEKIEKQVMQLSIFTVSSIAHTLTKTEKKGIVLLLYPSSVG